MTREQSIEIYKMFSRKLYNISLRIVGESGEAEEIMQDTILKFITAGPENLLRKIEGAKVGSANSAKKPVRVGRGQEEKNRDLEISGWLSKTCVRASIDALRRKKRERIFLDEYASEEAPEYFAPIDNERLTNGEANIDPSLALDIERVRRAIKALPESPRLILTLVLIEGLDYKEISDMTGENEGALRTRFSRARRMLAESLRSVALDQ